MKRTIPENIIEVIKKLEAAGFEAFIVGGCVRDILLGKEPKDWDVATNARPEEMLKIFPFGKYENEFGTVMVPRKYLLDMPIISEGLIISDETTEKLIEIAEQYASKIECRAHRLRHSENVAKNAVEIARTYKDINLNFMRLLSYFHDIGRIKYNDIKHIDESRKIFKKEAIDLLKDKTMEKIVEAMEHKHEERSRSLEQQILKEADIIDGIDVERVRIVKEINLKIHIDWIKSRFNDDHLYGIFLTPEGKEKMQKAILAFNDAHKDLAIPQMKEDNNNNIEITTYRIESKYSDKRHPDEVRFAKTLEEDLGRRDFTINALALRITHNVERGAREGTTIRDPRYAIIDLYGGQKDLKNKNIRAVGDASERFNEDALRMMRAIRFACTLNSQNKKSKIKNKNDNVKIKNAEGEAVWTIEKSTLEAIKKNAKNLKYISQERIRDELEKIILSLDPAGGIELLHETGLLGYIIPEIETGYDVTQSHHHYYGPYNTVYKHLLASLAKCPSPKLEVRLASLFHDIGKPRSKKGEGENATFYGHEYTGAKIAQKILERLRFSRAVIDKTVLLIKNHMFYYNVDEVGEAGVRRVIRKVGLENINDLIDVRIADRLGSGVPKAVPYKLRHFKFMVEKVSRDAVSVKQLKINGNDLIGELGLKPGPKIGAILEVLLSRVIDEPFLNQKEKLLEMARKLNKEEIESLRNQAKKKIAEEKKEEERLMKKKYWVE